MSVSQYDNSNGYEEVAERFMLARNPHIGAATVREWSHALTAGSAILDLGCGHGVPVSQVLTEEGLSLYGVDASAKLIESFHKRFPNAHAECAACEDSTFFGRAFDGVVAVGLMFLLRPDVQALLTRKVAKALNFNGRFLFTSPKEVIAWHDPLTNRESVSLGTERYHELLQVEGLILVGETEDEENNHYYSVRKP